MKNKGKGSKKVARRERAEARQKELSGLSPEQRKALFAQRKAAYDNWKAAK